MARRPTSHDTKRGSFLCVFADCKDRRSIPVAGLPVGSSSFTANPPAARGCSELRRGFSIVAVASQFQHILDIRYCRIARQKKLDNIFFVWLEAAGCPLEWRDIYPNLGLGTFGMREDGIVHDNLILCKVRHARDPPVDEPRRECIRNRERHRAQQYLQQQARHFRVDGLVRPRRHRSSACWPVFHGFEHHVENTAPLDW
mmetsp:Transcript_7176/g.16664  ORF Transcript_7176/g.16664 Transcript_7176/m.16664 type:complete len:200 (+) Transcript_7176:988-1587(+)